MLARLSTNRVLIRTTAATARAELIWVDSEPEKTASLAGLLEELWLYRVHKTADVDLHLIKVFAKECIYLFKR